MLLANSIENLYCNLYCLSQKMKMDQMIGIKNVKAVGGYVQNIKKKKKVSSTQCIWITSYLKPLKIKKWNKIPMSCYMKASFIWFQLIIFKTPSTIPSLHPAYFICVSYFPVLFASTSWETPTQKEYFDHVCYFHFKYVP